MLLQTKRIRKNTLALDQIENISETELKELIPEPEDFMSFGMIPEFIGRLPVIAMLSTLDKESLIKILTEPKNSLTKQYKKLFAIDNVTLDFEDDAIDMIAQIALEKKTGARGLRSILEQSMLEVMYKIPSEKNLEKCIITKSSILKQEVPLLVYKQES